MIFRQLHFALAVAFVGAILLGLVWQIRRQGAGRTESVRQVSAVTSDIVALEKQVADQSQRLATAEAKVAALLSSAKQASAPPAPAAAPIHAADFLQETITEARALLAEERQQEALDTYVAAYRELQAIRPASSECQSLMSAMQSLARNFPPARAALVSLRDAATAQRQTQPERRELVSEIALLNERLGEGHLTIALYDALPAGDPSRQSLASIANTSLIQARRYADVLIGKPFPRMLASLESGAQVLARQTDASLQTRLRTGIVGQALTDIEILTGAGNLDDARLLTEKLLAFDNTEATRARLAESIARARQNP